MVFLILEDIEEGFVVNHSLYLIVVIKFIICKDFNYYSGISFPHNFCYLRSFRNCTNDYCFNNYKMHFEGLKNNLHFFEEIYFK